MCSELGSTKLNPIPIFSFTESFSSFFNSHNLVPLKADRQMDSLTIESTDSFSSLLELAANDDVVGFKRFIECDPSALDEVGLWYGRQKGSKQMVYEHRTPLMVAAMYGSINVLKLILSLSIVDVNRSCGLDKSTALHCAASGGAVNVVDVVKLLLEAGADPNAVDANGYQPIDVVLVSPKLQGAKFGLEELLGVDGSLGDRQLMMPSVTSSSNPALVSSSPGKGSASSVSESPPSPINSKFDDQAVAYATERKEYPIDPSLPDIKNSIYATDEFRMYSFKIRPCSRAYSHDWTECPFVHPGENARRRDLRKYHYSCVPCPDFRKGACRRGDMCEYAHGVFECWLHPAQYRTRLCKDGTSCTRRVCFFAHTAEELRPLYVSGGGSGVPSPRSSAHGVMDFAAAMNYLPGSPSSVMPPTAFTPPMSPSGNGISHSNMAWPQPDVPSLRLPGSNLQSSRLRSSLSARDIPFEDLDMLSDFDIQQQQQQQLLNELSCLSMNSNSLNRSGRPRSLNPSNLDELFSAESSSPRYTDQASLTSAVYSPTHKSAVLNQFQQQQTMLSPIKTNYSPKTMEHPSYLQAPFGGSSPGRRSPRSIEPISPMSGRASSMLAQHEHQARLNQPFRSLSSRELGHSSNAAAAAAIGGGSPMGSSWSRWGSSNGEPDWSVNANELGRLKRSSSFEIGSNSEEPDLSWVHSLVKESPGDPKETPAAMPDSVGVGNSFLSSCEALTLSSQTDANDQSVVDGGCWSERMHPLMVQKN